MPSISLVSRMAFPCNRCTNLSFLVASCTFVANDGVFYEAHETGLMNKVGTALRCNSGFIIHQQYSRTSLIDDSRDEQKIDN